MRKLKNVLYFVAYLSISPSAATTEADVFCCNLSYFSGGAVVPPRNARGPSQVDPAPEARTGINCQDARKRPLRGVLYTKGTAPLLGVQKWLPEVLFGLPRLLLRAS